MTSLLTDEVDRLVLCVVRFKLFMFSFAIYGILKKRKVKTNNLFFYYVYIWAKESENRTEEDECEPFGRKKGEKRSCVLFLQIVFLPTEKLLLCEGGFNGEMKKSN